MSQPAMLDSGQEILDIFIRRVQQHRHRQHLSYAALAAASGIGLSHLHHTLTKGAKSGPNLFTVARIAAALDTTAAALITMPSCPRCLDWPPEGWPCGDCGRNGSASADALVPVRATDVVTALLAIEDGVEYRRNHPGTYDVARIADYRDAASRLAGAM
jgi:transcriptional regulator with XRE-family HTH domain